VQPGEGCDLGEDNTDLPYGNGCSNDCQPLPTCGDGTLDADYEACDDANDLDSDACTSECTIAACGDGYVYDGQEACDDGNDDDADACLSNCELPTCGDGIVHPGEECDGQDNCNHLCVRDRLVFATKDTHDGDLQFTGTLSGLEVADSACNSRANANGLNTDSYFIAWLSDAETSPAERFFRSPGRYVLVDGTVIAESWDDLTDGTLQNPINLSEEGDAPGQVGVWTNTNPDGTRYSANSCDEWSSIEDGLEAQVGAATKTDSQWTDLTIAGNC
ncbi:MAG: hypothetical protein ACPG4T_24505, partial [Nannocystaceae bacterium]